MRDSENKVTPDNPLSHIDELRRRVLGYSFGDPPSNWCSVGDDIYGIDLPVDATNCTGESSLWVKGGPNLQTMEIGVPGW